MPIYEYRCENGHTFEVMQRMADDPITKCEVCGAPVQRVFHPVAIHFKGKGFYNTDYGTKRKARELEKSAQRGRRQARRQGGVAEEGRRQEVQDVGVEAFQGEEEGLKRGRSALEEARHLAALLGTADDQAGAAARGRHGARRLQDPRRR